MRTILIAACFAALPMSAFAVQPESITIHVTQADLQSDATIAHLLDRVQGAAEIVCKQGDDGAFHVPNGERLCQKAAVSEAIREAKIEPLSAYVASMRAPHRGRTDQPTLASR